MPEKPASERTEQPTPERIKKAREKGRVPESREVFSAVVMAALVLVLLFSAARLIGWMAHQVDEGLTLCPRGDMDPQAMGHLLRSRGAECLRVLLPFVVTIGAASVLGSLLTGGWAFSMAALKPDLSRLSPVNGLRNLFSFRSVMQLWVSIAKLAVIVAIAWHYLNRRVDDLLAVQWASPRGTLATIGELLFGLAARVVGALVAIAAVDLLYQRWNYKRQLRMTRQEVKEERRQHEASPEVKGRVRAAQMAIVRRRMLQEVPQADVVVTNPRHYAVALRYDVESMDAPQVVAKGADFLCQKIKEIAERHNVPIVERPALARTLYATVDVGQAVPEALFVAVAEVLAMVYRMRKRTLRLP